MTERRKDSLVKSIIIPVAIATITGVTASYIATRITLAIVETKVSYIETDIVSIKDILSDVNKNQLVLAKRGEWMRNADKRISQLENVQKIVAQQTTDRYTRSEAKKDYAYLLEKITSSLSSNK